MQSSIRVAPDTHREAYDMFAVNGILFNHESPRRGETFVTCKITRAAVRVATGKQEKLFLGNLNAKRDWGHAKDYVRGMWLILQQEEPEDFVVATGESTSVREFCEMAFAHLGIELRWEGEGPNEKSTVDSIDEKQFEDSTSKPLNTSTLNLGEAIIEVDPHTFVPLRWKCYLAMPKKQKKS